MVLTFLPKPDFFLSFFPFLFPFFGTLIQFFPLNPVLVFPGLNLLDILPNLRNENDKDLDIQCDVFEEFKHEDDEEMAATFSGSVDIGNHRQLFDVIFSKVWSMAIEETEEGKGVGEGGVEKKHKKKKLQELQFSRIAQH